MPRRGPQPEIELGPWKLPAKYDPDLDLGLTKEEVIAMIQNEKPTPPAGAPQDALEKTEPVGIFLGQVNCSSCGELMPTTNPTSICPKCVKKTSHEIFKDNVAEAFRECVALRSRQAEAVGKLEEAKRNLGTVPVSHMHNCYRPGLMPDPILDVCHERCPAKAQKEGLAQLDAALSLLQPSTDRGEKR